MKARSKLKSAFILAVVGLCVLVMGEAVCRSLEYLTQCSPRSKYIFSKNNISEAKTLGLRHRDFNAYGFRCRNFEFEKAQDEYVIVILGGSVATGAWATKYAVMPAPYIEDQLGKHVWEQHRKKLKVYSLAEAGVVRG